MLLSLIYGGGGGGGGRGGGCPVVGWLAWSTGCPRITWSKE